MTYKKDNTTKSSLSNMALTFLSANSNAYPIAYADNVWDIIDSSSLLKALFGNEVLVGLYTLSDINNALAGKIADVQGNSVTLGQNTYGKVTSINSKDIYEPLSPTEVSGVNLLLSLQIGSTDWHINSATLNTISLKKGQVLVVTITNSGDQIGLTTNPAIAPSSGSSSPFYYKETNSTATYYIAVSRGNALITYSIFDTLESKDSGKIDAIYLKTGSADPQDPLTIDLNKAVTIDISWKVDKPSSPTSGNFASFDSSGNLVDSRKSNSSYLPSTQQTNLPSSAVGGSSTIPVITVNKYGIVTALGSASIQSANDGTITINANGTQAGEFNVNQSTDTTINIDDDYFTSSEVSNSNHSVNGLIPEAGNYYFIKMASATVNGDAINSKPVFTYANGTYTAVTANAWQANDIINVYYQEYLDANEDTQYRFILINKANGIYQTTANVEKILGDINAALDAIIGGN